MLLPLLLACADPVPEDLDTDLERGWVASILREPDQFSATVDANRDGWIALHANNLDAAINAGGPPAVRAQHELEQLYVALSAMASHAWQEAAETWAARAGIPAGSALPLVAAFAALEGGDKEAARLWAEKLDESAPPEHQQLAAEIAAGDITDQTPLGACYRSHLAVRQGDAMSTDCPSPLVEEDGRTLHDPMVFATRAAQLRAPEAVAGLSGLEATLFSARWPGSGSPPVALVDSFATGEHDDPDGLRQRVRAADALLARWEKQQRDAAPEGLSLLDELKLIEGYRSRALAEHGRQRLLAGQPRSAQAAALMALDAEAGRAVTALNPPVLFVVLADADVRTGRSREALDMLAPLADVTPEVSGLVETLGDLVVLEGMTRLGDSKEN